MPEGASQASLGGLSTVRIHAFPAHPAVCPCREAEPRTHWARRRPCDEKAKPKSRTQEPVDRLRGSLGARVAPGAGHRSKHSPVLRSGEARLWPSPDLLCQFQERRAWALGSRGQALSTPEDLPAFQSTFPPSWALATGPHPHPPPADTVPCLPQDPRAPWAPRGSTPWSWCCSLSESSWA